MKNKFISKKAMSRFKAPSKNDTKNILKLIVLGIGFLCIFCAALATPIGIGTAIYQYAYGVELGMSLWIGFKTWILMLLMALPGAVIITAAREF